MEIGDSKGTQLDGVTIVDGTLVVALAKTRVEFGFAVPIFFDVRQNALRYTIGGVVEKSMMFQTALSNGLHLRQDLSRADTFPYPLAVGNLWRYRVSEGERQNGATDKFERGLAGGDSPTELTLELTAIDRLGVIRIVTFRRTYNRGDEPVAEERWLVTPTQVYVCDDSCFEDRHHLEKLMTYFSSREAIFTNPLESGEIFKIGPTRSIETPAGRFESVVPMTGGGDLGFYDSVFAARQTRYFKPGLGVVLRELHVFPPVFFELIEVRLLPP